MIKMKYRRKGAQQIAAKGEKQEKSVAVKSRFNRAMNSLPARTTSYAEYSRRFEKLREDVEMGKGPG